MKKLLPVLFALVLLNSCNKEFKVLTDINRAYNKVVERVDIKLPKQEGKLTVFEAKVDSLYSTVEFKKRCPYALFSLDAANSTATVKVKCYTDSIPVLNGLPKQIVDVLNKK